MLAPKKITRVTAHSCMTASRECSPLLAYDRAFNWRRQSSVLTLLALAWNSDQANFDRHGSGSLIHTLYRRSHDRFLSFRQQLTSGVMVIKDGTVTQPHPHATDVETPLIADTKASNRSGSGSRSAQTSSRIRNGRHSGQCYAGSRYRRLAP